MTNSSIKHFTHLIAWQRNHKLVLEVYKLTKRFPREEIYGLTSQIRRAVASITGNIAEGFGRFGYKDKKRFYVIARGSSAEVQNYLIISKDLGYFSEEEYNNIIMNSLEGYKLLCGLISSTEKFNTN